MVYIGIAWATAFMRISLPLIERIFSFHPNNILPTLSLISANNSFLDLPMIEGRPRYLLCRESCISPKIFRVSFFFSSVVLAQKKTEDLSVLIFWPEATSYKWKISTNCWHSRLLDFQKSRLSFAKKRCVSIG